MVMVTYMSAFINVILRYLGENLESAVFFFFFMAVSAIAFTINSTNYCVFRRRLVVILIGGFVTVAVAETAFTINAFLAVAGVDVVDPFCPRSRPRSRFRIYGLSRMK